MRKTKKILAFILAVNMVLSSDKLALFASELETEQIVQTTETDSVEGTEESISTELVEESEIAEEVVADETTETTEMTEVVEDIENTESVKAVEETEAMQTIEVATTASVDDMGATTTPSSTGYVEIPRESETPGVRYDLIENGDVPQFYKTALESSYENTNRPAIRNQNPYGTCWAFSAVSLAELDLMQQGAVNVDLSELHLAYHTYYSEVDPLGGTTGDSNVLDENAAYNFLNIGGNLYFASRALANWMGYADETVAPYSAASDVVAKVENGQKGLECVAYQDVAHLKNAYYINIAQNPEIVKAMIKEYGGVGISYYAATQEMGKYYNATTNAHYVYDVTGSDHAVTLVGWDDNFPATNFTKQAPGNGAWLVRNSWGSRNDEYNESGYFWLSYYDTSINDTAYVFDVTGTGGADYYDNNYQYDGSINDASLNLGGTTIKAANIFSAHSGSSNEILEAVSFSTSGANQTYKIDVYHNLANAANPESGTLVASKEGSCDYSGYYTIELDNPVSIANGDTFSVVVTLTSLLSTSYAKISVEYPYQSVNYPTVACTATAEAGQSFLYNGGWEDFGVSDELNICIKAFTNNAEQIAVTGINIPQETAELGIGEELQLTAEITPSTVSNRNVTWTSDNEEVATVDARGKVTAHKVGTAKVTVCTEDGGYTDFITINVTKKLTAISLNTTELQVELHKQAQLMVSYEPEDTITDKTVTWSSSKPSVATVDSTGMVTAQGYGTCVITARVADKEAECFVFVMPPCPVLSPAMWQEDGIALNWTMSEGATSYDIYRYYAGNTQYIDTVGTGVTSYTDTSAVAGRRYLYYVVSEYLDEQYRAQSYSNVVANTYRLNYMLNGGTNAEGNPDTFNWMEDVFALANPTHDRAIFEGWYYESTFKTKVTTINPYSTLKDVTVYAKWRERQSIQEDWLSYQPVQDYTGTEVNPTIVVKNGNYILKEGTDYTVSQTKRTEDGVNYCDVTITGVGEYIDSQTVTITERKATLQSGMVEKMASVVYTGNAIEAKPVVMFNGLTLREGVDYSLSYVNNVEVGTAAVTITGMGHFTGSVKKNFVIQSKNLEKSFVEELLAQPYTGEEIEPEIVLTYNGNPLRKNIDYSISYSSNVEVGLATATIRGRGNYGGTLKIPFWIVAAPLETLISQGDLQVLLEGEGADFETSYTGEEILPEVRLVFSDGKTLEEKKDYTLSYENNLLPGTAVIRIKGIGSYTGEIEKEFIIKPHNIANAEVTLGKQITVLYNTLEQKASPRVLYNNKRLTEGKDYEVAYYAINENGVRTGVELSGVTDAGRYEAVLKGMGVYVGTLENAAVVTVRPRALNSSILEVKHPYARIDGENVTARYELWYRNEQLQVDEDFAVRYVVNEEKTFVTFIFEGTGNYTGTLTQKFPLIAADVILFADGEYEIADIIDQSYTGERICPSVTVKEIVGERVLVEGEDYTVSYKYNLNAGTAKVKVQGIGNCIGTLESTFDILPVEAEELVTTLEQTEFVYDGSVYRPKATVIFDNVLLEEGRDYTLTYENANGSQIVSRDAGVYQAIVTLQGNYSGEISCDYEIKSLEVGELVIQLPQQVYTGTEIVPDILNANVLLDGRNLTVAERAGLEVTAVANNVEVTKQSSAVATISGEGNFKGETNVSFQIVQKDIAASDITFIMEGEDVTSSNALYQVEWDGTEKKPGLEIWHNAVKLEENEDYTLDYRYNTDIGTARVVISGKDNYSGEKIIFFEIVGMELSEEFGYDILLEENSFEYDGKAKCPQVSVIKGDKVLRQGTDYYVSYENNVNAGTAKAVITGSGYYTGTVSKEFTIQPVAIKDHNVVSVSKIAAQNYTGEVIVPNVTVTLDGMKLVKGKDYTVSTLNAIEAGTATLIVSGTGNYKGVMAEVPFQIRYVITYVMNGGVNSPNNLTYYMGTENITFANPQSRNGYKFMGWYSDSSYTNQIYGIAPGTTGNQTVYAKWVPLQVNGIDVSSYQGAIDWQAVKDSGVTFAIIRAGYRGYGAAGTLVTDTRFEKNIKDATAAGIKVGVYFYTQATNKAEAVAEANYVIQLVKDYDLTYPIFIDTEDAPNADGRADGLDRATRTECVKAFCDRIEDAGYDAGVYASTSWYNTMLYDSQLSQYCIWVAQYNTSCSYGGNYRIWQYTSKGSVRGISGNVDLDVCYEDYIK